LEIPERLAAPTAPLNSVLVKDDHVTVFGLLLLECVKVNGFDLFKFLGKEEYEILLSFSTGQPYIQNPKWYFVTSGLLLGLRLRSRFY
jgi:hypothetical protein